MTIRQYFIEDDRKYKFFIWVLVFITISLGILANLHYGHYFLLGDLQKLNNDDVRYLNTAKVLLEQGTLIYYGTDPTVFIMPGYPLFLVVIMKIFGTGDTGIIAVRGAQAILQGASLYVLYFLTKEIFNRRVAIIASIITTLYIPEYITANLILTEVLYKFLFIILFYFAIIAIKENKMSYYIITSILWASLCLVRPNAAVFPVLIIVGWILSKYNILEMIKYTFVAFIIFVLMFSPWWIRNFKITGHFVLFTESSANPKLQGALIKDKDPSFSEDIPAEYKYKEYRNGNYLKEEEQKKLGDYIRKKGFEENFIKYAKWYTIGKVKELYKEPYCWKPIFRVEESSVGRYHIFILVTSILGFIAMIVRREKKSILLITLLIISTIVYCPFVTFSRYGYPNMFMLIMAAAYMINIVLFKDRLESKKYS